MLKKDRMKNSTEHLRKIDYLHDYCPVRAALDVIQGRWKPSILFYLQNGPRRFSELQDAINKASAQTLTVQLRQLENDGVILRTVHPEIPPRVEYSLTPLGKALTDITNLLGDWTTQYNQQKASINPAHSPR